MTPLTAALSPWATSWRSDLDRSWYFAASARDPWICWPGPQFVKIIGTLIRDPITSRCRCLRAVQR